MDTPDVRPAPVEHEMPEAPRKDLSKAYPGVWITTKAESTNHILIDGEAACGNASSHVLHKCQYSDNPPITPVTDWWRIRDLRNYNLCGSCRRVLESHLGAVDFADGEYHALEDHLEGISSEEVVIVEEKRGRADRTLTAVDWRAYDNLRGSGFAVFTDDGEEEYIEPGDVLFVYSTPDES